MMAKAETGRRRERRCGSKAGSYLRFIDPCITQR
jgi:hypothetical protein